MDRIRRIFGSVLMALLAVSMTMISVMLLVGATLTIAELPSAALRAVGMAAELILGVVLLVGTVYLATRLAVRIFGSGPQDTRH